MPVLDGSGEIIHVGGITPSRGLYVVGLRFLLRRDASFISAVTGDATGVALDIRRYLDAQPCAAA